MEMELSEFLERTRELRERYGNDGDHQVYTPDIQFMTQSNGVFIIVGTERSRSFMSLSYDGKANEHLLLEKYARTACATAWSEFPGNRRVNGITDLLRRIPRVLADVERDSRLGDFEEPLKDFYMRTMRELQSGKPN